MHGVWSLIVESEDGSLAVCKNCILVLYRRVGRKPSIFLGATHGATRRRKPHPQVVRSLELQARNVPWKVCRIQVVVIGAQCAASLGELGKGQHAGPIDRLRIKVFPYIIKIRKPVKEFCVLSAGQVSRQCLIKMVMRIDKAWQHHVPGSIDNLSLGWNFQIRADLFYSVPIDENIYVMQIDAALFAGHDAEAVF